MTMRALDLTKEYPRSPYATVAGIPWLPRLLDKVRALNAGTLGEYTPFPCGGDRGFLKAMGIEPEALKPVIDRGASDEEVADWVKAHAPAGWEARLDDYRKQAVQPVTGERAEYLKQAIARTAEACPGKDFSQVKNFNELICVEEGHPVPTHGIA